MKPILKVDNIRDWDQFTIDNEPIKSIDLMERASNVFVNWLIENIGIINQKILIIASKGNKGDGLQ
ncbi:MAG: hypothetical protein R2771_03185 [Saprospiraceae bacterium]